MRCHHDRVFHPSDSPAFLRGVRVPLSRVTPKVLTQSLRAPERDGPLKHTVYAGADPHVEHELTPVGRSMREPMAVACAWPSSIRLR
ncbi:winged helix-turn-helix transcriptional regulator [Micromonospora echinospora]